MSEVGSGPGLIGRVLHETYRITRLIGEGGMGAVYEAVHARLAKKRFAVKMLLPSVLAIPDVYARFRREAEITTELGHPNIVDVLDFNETEEGLPYMVMEFLEGEDLAVRLHRRLRLTPVDVAQVIEQTASALQAAHDHDIVHRDMKPDNIFLAGDKDGPIRVKVLDFGISKIRHSSKSFATRENSVLGTPSFMSPEQAEGSVSDIDQTTDIFALGSICYQALSGELPFAAPTMPGVLYKVCHMDPTPVSQLVPELPLEIDQVLARAMAKRKADRYQRADELARDVAAALGVELATPARLKTGATEISSPRAGVAAAVVQTTSQAATADQRRRIPNAAGAMPTGPNLPPSPEGPRALTGPELSAASQHGAAAPVISAEAGPVASLTTLSAAAAEEVDSDARLVRGRPWLMIGGAAAAVVLIAVVAILALRGGARTQSGVKPREPSSAAAPAAGATADARISVASPTVRPDAAASREEPVVAEPDRKKRKKRPSDEARPAPVTPRRGAEDRQTPHRATSKAAAPPPDKKAAAEKAPVRKGPLVQDLDDKAPTKPPKKLIYNDL